jgi:hypothetical protein
MIDQEIPTVDLRTFIADLAKRHGVVRVRTGMSALAEVITRLSDDEVKPMPLYTSLTLSLR